MRGAGLIHEDQVFPNRLFDPLHVSQMERLEHSVYDKGVGQVPCFANHEDLDVSSDYSGSLLHSKGRSWRTACFPELDTTEQYICPAEGIEYPTKTNRRTG